jgi:hypothetical protein
MRRAYSWPTTPSDVAPVGMPEGAWARQVEAPGSATAIQKVVARLPPRSQRDSPAHFGAVVPRPHLQGRVEPRPPLSRGGRQAIAPLALLGEHFGRMPFGIGTACGRRGTAKPLPPMASALPTGPAMGGRSANKSSAKPDPDAPKLLPVKTLASTYQKLRTGSILTACVEYLWTTRASIRRRRNSDRTNRNHRSSAHN